MDYDFSKLTNLALLKEFCNSHASDISSHNLRTKKNLTKVRFIDPNGDYGYTGLGRFFFMDDCMYMLTNNAKFEPDHNPDILEHHEELESLKYTNEYVVRVMFAGIFTGFLDDKGQRVFTGDVIHANVVNNPTYPSTGGTERAQTVNCKGDGSFYEAGVNEMFGEYSLILDNMSIPLSWVKKLKVVGSLFFDLKKEDTEIDIQGLCNMFAQTRTERNELRKLIKKSPYFPPVTWQEGVLEILCGTKDENNE